MSPAPRATACGSFWGLLSLSLNLSGAAGLGERTAAGIKYISSRPLGPRYFFASRSLLEVLPRPVGHVVGSGVGQLVDVAAVAGVHHVELLGAGAAGGESGLAGARG